jgi:exodeoxyribonuclease VII small subunit
MGKIEEEMTFEAALLELEEIVERLEGGDLTLATSLELYERGQELARFCRRQLETASLRVEQLTEEGEIIELEAE